MIRRSPPPPNYPAATTQLLHRSSTLCKGGIKDQATFQNFPNFFCERLNSGDSGENLFIAQGNKT